MNEITIGDKVYISAKRAAEITGYARDYVGQLCREGHIDAKMVGRSWYVYEPAIRAHRFGPEALVEPHVASAEVLEQAAPDQSTAQDTGEREKPTYTAEKPDFLPELETPKLEELLPPAEETLTDMQAAWREWFEQRQTELQTPEIESPDVIDERNEAYEAAHEVEEAPEMAPIEEAESEEVSIPLHHIEPEQPVEEEIVPIRSIPAAPEPVSTPVRASHVDIARSTPVVARYSNEPTARPIEHENEQGKIVSERIVVRATGKKSKQGRARTGSHAPMIALLVGLSLVSVAVAAVGTGYATRYLKTLPAENNPAINYLVGTERFVRE